MQLKIVFLLLLFYYSFAHSKNTATPQNDFMYPLISHSNKKNPPFFKLYSKLYKIIKINQSPPKSAFKKLLSLAHKAELPYVELLHYLHALHQLSSVSTYEKTYFYAQLKPLLPKFSTEEQEIILRYTAQQQSSLYLKRTIETEFSDLFARKEQIKREDILKILNHKKAKEFKAYIEKKQRSFLDKIIFKKFMQILHKNDVAKILATLSMQDNNFIEAQYYIRQAPRENIYSPYNPFNSTLIGNNQILSRKDYSLRAFAETMLRIEDTLSKHPKSARDHFLYATGLYNKSWFGNFPLSSVFYQKERLSKPLPRTVNLHQVKNEYHRAFYYTNENNLKAKITYQLLKIKFNDLFIRTFKRSKKREFTFPLFGKKQELPVKVIKTLQNNRDFKEAINDFKAEYSHTKFGKKAIKSNALFQYF